MCDNWVLSRRPDYPAVMASQMDLNLFERTHFEEVDFFLCEVAPTASGKVLFGEPGEVDAVELSDVVAERFEDSAHDAVSSRMDFDADLVAVVLGGVRNCVGMDFAVFEFDAVGDALHIVFGYVFIGPYVIDFFLDVFGVSEFGGEVAVVGEQKDAGGVAVETAYGIDAFVAGSFHEVHNSEAAVGVVGSGDAVLWFVEKDVAFAFECHNFVIVFYNVAVRNFSSEFGYNLTVYFYEALLDEFIGFAA